MRSRSSSAPSSATSRSRPAVRAFISEPFLSRTFRAFELDGELIKLPGEPLAATIELVARAASRDEVRPILTGVLVQAEGDTLTMVATDSYRLSVKHTKLDAAVAQALEANVPARALRELARIVAAEGAEEVEIALPRNQIVFRAAGVLVSSRLIEGQFSSWRQLVPESFEHEIRLPREEFLEIARRVSQLAQRNAPLRLAFTEGELTVAAETPDIGDASEGMPAPTAASRSRSRSTRSSWSRGSRASAPKSWRSSSVRRFGPGCCGRSTATTSAIS